MEKFRGTEKTPIRLKFQKDIIGFNLFKSSLSHSQTRKYQFHPRTVLGFSAEGTGFEPVRDCSQPVFETGAFNHSANPPIHSLFQSSYCRAPFSCERLAECLPP